MECKQLWLVDNIFWLVDTTFCWLIPLSGWLIPLFGWLIPLSGWLIPLSGWLIPRLGVDAASPRSTLAPGINHCVFGINHPFSGINHPVSGINHRGFWYQPSVFWYQPLCLWYQPALPGAGAARLRGQKCAANVLSTTQFSIVKHKAPSLNSIFGTREKSSTGPRDEQINVPRAFSILLYFVFNVALIISGA